MSIPITLCILIASGYERENTPAVQSERLKLLLESIFLNGERFNSGVRVLVSDDYSNNFDAQAECLRVCKKFEVEYTLNPPPWRGPCGNYNHAVYQSKTEFVAMLGDDQFVTPGWWEWMSYFIEKNPTLKWGMLGWCVIFMEELIKVGYCDRREDFYLNSEILWRIKVETLPKLALGQVESLCFNQIKGWCSWERPTFRAACSGTAFVIRRSLWKRFNGFYEELYQFDEDYGDNVVMTTDHLCIQVPTPPILHYGGACAWPSEKGPADRRWRKGWETRPLVPVTFEERGKEAKKIQGKIPPSVLESVEYKRLM